MEKNTRHEAFILNLKKANNDIYLTLDGLDRAYYATDNPDDFHMVEEVIGKLLHIRNELQARIEKG